MGVSISDATSQRLGLDDAITITADAGELLLQGAGSTGVTAGTGGSGTRSVTLTGSVAQIDAALATLAYVGGGQDDTITITAKAEGLDTATTQAIIGVRGDPGTAPQTYVWQKAVPAGAYGNSASWTPSGVPGTQDGAAFLQIGSYAVSGAGAAATLEVSDTMTATGTLLVAGLAGVALKVERSGDLTLRDGAALTAGATTIVGTNGSGVLTLSSNTVLDQTGLATTSVLIGRPAGTMTVNASRWSNSSAVIVGETGPGLLTIGDESRVVIGDPSTSDGFFEIAEEPYATGRVSVEGNRTSFTVNGDVVVVKGTDAAAHNHGVLLIGPGVTTEITRTLTVRYGGLVQIQSAISVGGLDVAAGGVFTGDARIAVIGPVTNDGVIEAPTGSTGLALDIHRPITGTGTLKIDDGATLEVSGAIGAGQVIAFGADSTLDLSAAPGKIAVQGTLAGFGAGDAVVFARDRLTGVAYDPGSHVATVTDRNGNTFGLSFAGTYAADGFTIYGSNVVGLMQPIGIVTPPQVRSVQGLANPLLGLGVADLDPAARTMTATFTDTFGTLSVADVAGATIGGMGSHTLSISGLVSAVRADLQQVTYTAPSTADDPSGSDVIGLSISDDQGASHAASIPVTITAKSSATLAWTGPAGGAFDGAANWGGGGPPGNGDIVRFGSPAAVGFYTVTGPGAAAQVQFAYDGTTVFNGPIFASGTSGSTNYSVAIDIDGSSTSIFGLGSSLQAGAGIVVGDRSIGTLQLAGGTGAITSTVRDLVLGNTSLAVGNFVADSTMDVGRNVVAGAAGIGNVSLYGERARLVDQNGILGQSLHSTGSATVSGGQWISSGTLDVGLNGTGFLKIDPFISGDGAPRVGVEDADGVVAAGAGSKGTVVLDQGVWLNSRSLTVGQTGEGDVQLLNGATVSTSNPGSPAGLVSITLGSVEVSDGSTFGCYGDINIGATSTFSSGLARVTVGEYDGDSGLFGATGTIRILSDSVVTLHNGVRPAQTAVSSSVLLQAATLDIAGLGRLTGDGAVVGTSSDGLVRGPNQSPPASYALAAVDNAGDIEANGGRLLLHANVGGSGTMSIASGAELDVQGSGASGLTTRFQGSGARLSLGDVANFASDIQGFARSDTIDLSGVAETSATWNNGTLELSGGAQAYSLRLTGDYAASSFIARSDDAGGTIVEFACYCSGTRILTDRGEVAVELLAEGDLVVTAAGEERSVKWLGQRTLDVGLHPNPKAVRPVRVQAGAFGGGLPHRDLWLSPGHSVFADGMLVPIKYLVNGASVAQVETDRVTYWHVELDSHDVLLAEGLPAESYLDTGNRTAFENGGAFLDLHPAFEPSSGNATCAPLYKKGPLVGIVRARLLARAERLGHGVTADPDLHVLADGIRIEGVKLGRERFRFDLPADIATVRLASRTWVPAQHLPESRDQRSLGVCLRALEVDGVPVALDALEGGWHKLDRDGSRWTDGGGSLSGPARRVDVELCGRRRYWDDGATAATSEAASRAAA